MSVTATTAAVVTDDWQIHRTKSLRLVTFTHLNTLLYWQVLCSLLVCGCGELTQIIMSHILTDKLSTLSRNSRVQNDSIFVNLTTKLKKTQTLHISMSRYNAQ